jgi:hypothetical protein
VKKGGWAYFKTVYYYNPLVTASRAIDVEYKKISWMKARISI